MSVIYESSDIRQSYSSINNTFDKKSYDPKTQHIFVKEEDSSMYSTSQPLQGSVTQ